MSTSLDYFSRGLERAFAKRQVEQIKQLAEQQEIQSVQEKVQQLLTIADLKTEIATFQNTGNSIATANDPNALTDSEEQYRQTIITKMVALIKQRKMK